MKFIFQQKPKEQLFQMTLRSRIHLAMLSVVMLSFVVIGVVTIFVFVDRYDNNNKMKLRKTMQVAERAVQDYFKSKNIRPDAVSFHHETSSPQFKNYLFNLANKEHLDINVYNFYGSLNATSQENIYNKALLARIMAPDAYYKMSELHKSLLVEVEKIGSLQYLSSYIPVRDNEGNTAGYINIPFFASQKELNYQISNILVALINLYTLIFLVSGALAVGIANWLTKGLQVLIEKFKTFDLKENEKIAWAYDDEIGLLLREYNKMVEKVVENAKRLAQSERESAWREMAKQVAHEIKNPLTPMKLNIQYLQQAMDRKQNNIEQLTKNVATSLIEQIDTLSNIASAFADFAKMPEATPELINLNEVVKNAVELYNNSHQVQVHLEMPEEKLISFVDKTQLLRVCNNLLKNALEAIPEDRQPNIHVSLEKKETQAILKIQDNGSGISDETAAHIFSPYFTTKGSGTGLGLAMTKRIIDFWKGKIYFETAEDKGTTFFIELPIRM
jgi:signal transduction histidine kinase